MTEPTEGDNPELRATRDRIRGLGQRGEYRDAADAADRALAKWPGDAELHLLRALAAERLNQWETVVREAEAFERLAPDREPMDISAGWALLQLRRPEDALVRLERAITMFPTNATAWMNLGVTCKQLGDLERAIECQRRATEVGANRRQPWLNLATAYQDAGRPHDALAILDALRSKVGTIAEAESFRAFLTLCLPTTNPLAHRLAAERAAAAIEAAAQPFATPYRFRNERKRNRRLRVGFFSGDFRDHSVASFALPLIEAIDRSTIEPLLFSTVPSADSIAERFRRAAPMIEVHGMEAKRVVESARGKQLDVAVDLAGHSSGNALTAFAARIAPVQVTWLGYAGTTGLRAMDARFVDTVTDPPTTAGTCTERLTMLDPCFLCWRTREDVALPTSATQTVPTDPSQTEARRAAVTFGSFNDLAKLSDPTVELWSELLRRQPESRLLLKNYSLRFASVRETTRQRFARFGITAERIETIAWSPTTTAHLELYGEVDVALDPFPYNGTTSTCEALWMGTPVVTLEGTAHHARVGTSILRTIGRADWVAPSREAYIELALCLAAEARTGFKDERRRSIRDAVERSPLRDETSFARRFESALRALWHGWCDKPATAM
jgi:protein O-GlcNAc transferase